ncbi:MAG: hypothetical protein GX628_04365 [Clostridiales bacterium]|nr:hypothetical protein [Clostridiales bacterium]
MGVIQKMILAVKRFGWGLVFRDDVGRGAQHEPVRTINCKPAELTPLFSCNPVFHLKTADGSEEGYFTAAFRRLPEEEYVNTCVRDYYRFFCRVFESADSKSAGTAYSAELEREEAAVIAHLADEENRRLFFNMDRRFSGKGNIIRFREGGPACEVGLPELGQDSAMERLRGFANKFAWQILAQYRWTDYIPYGAYHTHRLNNSFASEALARLVGYGDMFPYAEYCAVALEGRDEPLFGMLMEPAEGINITALSIEERVKLLTPEVLSQLNVLLLLDCVSLEIDHGAANYRVKLSPDGRAVGLSVFDSKSLSTFGSYKDFRVVGLSFGLSPIVADGRYLLPCADREAVRRLRRLARHPLRMRRALRPYIGDYAVWRAFCRLRKLLSAIKKSTADGSCRLLRSDEWSVEAVADELGGADMGSYGKNCKYGKTYVTVFAGL